MRSPTLVTKAERNGLDFPVDRALANTPPARKQVAINLAPEMGVGAREIGFAVLFIFSRMLGKNGL